jgi:hypothetical protein
MRPHSLSVWPYASLATLTLVICIATVTLNQGGHNHGGEDSYGLHCSASTVFPAFTRLFLYHYRWLCYKSTSFAIRSTTFYMTSISHTGLELLSGTIEHNGVLDLPDDGSINLEPVSSVSDSNVLGAMTTLEGRLSSAAKSGRAARARRPPRALAGVYMLHTHMHMCIRKILRTKYPVLFALHAVTYTFCFSSWANICAVFFPPRRWRRSPRTVTRYFPNCRNWCVPHQSCHGRMSLWQGRENRGM